MVLGTCQCLHTLAVGRGGLVYVAGDRCRADETHRFDVGVSEKAVDCHLVSVDEVEYSWWEPSLVEQLNKHLGSRRVLRRWLQDEGIAGSHRVGEHPQGDHGREVEGRDTCNYSEWLADVVHVDSG